MVYKGTFKGGVVIMEPGATLAEGEQVEVHPLREGAGQEAVRGSSEDGDDEGPTLYEQFKDWIGTCPDLPSDMAENHDHYIHGTPKRVTDNA